MIENFEFSDAKQVRKTLLITSFAGICFIELVKNSTGNIEFLGFKIPVEDASIIPRLVGCIIIFEIFALLIRYGDETLREKYNRYLEYIKDYKPNSLRMSVPISNIPSKIIPNITHNKIVRFSVVFLDIIFPILFGFYTLVKIFCK